MKTSRLVIFLILALVATCVAGNTYAQQQENKSKKKHSKKHEEENSDDKPIKYTKYERREIRRKERAERKKLKRERRHRREEENEAPAESRSYKQPKTTDNKTVKYPQSTWRPRYRIDVLASMYLDDLVKSGNVTFKNKMPDKAVPGVSFYEGVSLAADSLKKAGYNIDIYIHDIASVAESPEMLLKKGMLDSADLIIGAIPSSDIPDLAAYAKKRKINFISALSPNDAGVKGNKYFTVMLPTLKSHCEWIVDDVQKKFPGMKVTMLYRTSQEADENAYKYITGYNDGSINYKTFYCSAIPNKENLAPFFDLSKPNVVIIPILDPASADSILKVLSKEFSGTHFEVYGMPSWNAISDLRKEDKLANLSVNVTSPFNFEPASAINNYVARTYKRDYGGKASEYVYRGFESIFWYSYLLKQYGTLFNPNYNDIAYAPFTKFDVKPRRDNDGHLLYNENTHIFLTKYEGGAHKTE